MNKLDIPSFNRSLLILLFDIVADPKVSIRVDACEHHISGSAAIAAERWLILVRFGMLVLICLFL